MMLKFHSSQDNTIVCLQDKATSVLDIENDKYKNPGHYHTTDEQCRIIFGPTYMLDHFNEVIL